MQTKRGPLDGGHKVFTVCHSSKSPIEPPDFEQAARFLTLLDETAERGFTDHLQALPTIGGAQ